MISIDLLPCNCLLAKCLFKTEDAQHLEAASFSSDACLLNAVLLADDSGLCGFHCTIMGVANSKFMCFHTLTCPRPSRRIATGRTRWSRHACCPPIFVVSARLITAYKQLRSYLELGHVQATIFILVHHLEDLLHPLLRCVLILW